MPLASRAGRGRLACGLAGVVSGMQVRQLPWEAFPSLHAAKIKPAYRIGHSFIVSRLLACLPAHVTGSSEGPPRLAQREQLVMCWELQSY